MVFFGLRFNELATVELFVSLVREGFDYLLAANYLNTSTNCSMGTLNRRYKTALYRIKDINTAIRIKLPCTI